MTCVCSYTFTVLVLDAETWEVRKKKLHWMNYKRCSSLGWPAQGQSHGRNLEPIGDSLLNAWRWLSLLEILILLYFQKRHQTWTWHWTWTEPTPPRLPALCYGSPCTLPLPPLPPALPKAHKPPTSFPLCGPRLSALWMFPFCNSKPHKDGSGNCRPVHLSNSEKCFVITKQRVWEG